MAKIVLSDKAPKGEGKLRFSLGMAEFSPPFTTTDPDVLANANAHPWLEVEADKAEAVEVPNPFPVTVTEPFNANDPKLVRAELERRGLLNQNEVQGVALDAELDQTKPVTIEPDVAQTFAAIDEPKDTTKKGGK